MATRKSGTRHEGRIPRDLLVGRVSQARKSTRPVPRRPSSVLPRSITGRSGPGPPDASIRSFNRHPQLIVACHGEAPCHLAGGLPDQRSDTGDGRSRATSQRDCPSRLEARARRHESECEGHEAAKTGSPTGARCPSRREDGPAVQWVLRRLNPFPISLVLDRSRGRVATGTDRQTPMATRQHPHRPRCRRMLQQPGNPHRNRFRLPPPVRVTRTRTAAGRDRHHAHDRDSQAMGDACRKRHAGVRRVPQAHPTIRPTRGVETSGH